MSKGQTLLSAWRARLGLDPARPEAAGAPADDLATRVERAGEAIRRAGEQATLDMPQPVLSDAAAALVALTRRGGDAVEGKAAPATAALASLEAVVAFDGSRPSFLIRNAEVDLESSYATMSWRQDVEAMRSTLARFQACVGRIDRAGSLVGTGALLAPTLAMTNRHVLQKIAVFDGAAWRMQAHVTLDFGKEKDGIESLDHRLVTGVVFAELETVDPENIIHDRLDLALVRVTPSCRHAPDKDRALAVGGLSAVDIADFEQKVGTVGYPGAPDEAFIKRLQLTEHADAIGKLLGGGGFKRFAPGFSDGMLPKSASHRNNWTLRHDATTFGGNSGSPIIAFGAGSLRPAPTAAALHYGGNWRQGKRANWAHVITAGMAARGQDGRTLAEVLSAEAVSIA